MASSGSVGYVGLVVPHLVRLSFGSDNRLVIPGVGAGRREFCDSRGHNCAHFDRAARIAGRRHHRTDRRAVVYLLAEDEASQKSRVGAATKLNGKKCWKRATSRSNMDHRQAVANISLRSQPGENHRNHWPERRRKIDSATGAQWRDQTVRRRDHAWTDKPLKSFARRAMARRIAVVAQEADLRFPVTVMEFVWCRYAWSSASSVGLGKCGATSKSRAQSSLKPSWKGLKRV